MKIVGPLVILLLLTILRGQTQNLDSRVLEIKIKSNGDYDFEGAAFLKEELRNADIILLGEPYHQAKYYPVKIQLVKYLHDQLGFGVIAFESGLFQMEMVNADIKSGEETFSAFEKGLFPIWTSTYEFEELYGYLDSLKSVGSSMEIAGFDCQVSGSNASNRFVASLEQASKDNGIAIEKKPLQILQAQFENLETGKKGLTADFDGESINELLKLEKSIRAIPSLSLLHQSLLGFIGHFTDLYKNKIHEKIVNGSFDFSDSNVRDSLMAMQLMYLHRQCYPGKKLIAWGASLHFANQVQPLEAEHPAKGYKPMGYHLKKELGNKVFCLAITTDDNIPNTMEWGLAKRKIDAAWLSHKLLQDSLVTSCSLGQLIGKGNWSMVVDGILYFDSSPIQKQNTDANAYLIKGQIVDAKTWLPVSYGGIMLNGTHVGTASEANGNFYLKVDSSQLNKTLIISCIGYKSKYVSVARILKAKNAFQILLTPEVELLREVVINAKAFGAKEILTEAIQRIPENYVQSPFNMEFYSIINVLDTASSQDYKVESIFSTYYEGYSKGSKKSYRIIQKRESGEYFMKEKTHGKGQWPMVEVAFNDLFNNEYNKNIFSVEAFEKINLKLLGVKLFNSDTVFVITYDYLVHGEIYISAKDYAFVKHITTSTGLGFRNRMEIIYRKEEGKYFPYGANGDYLHVYKVDRKKKFLKISNRTILKRFKLENPDSFDENYDLWQPKNIAFNKDYWDSNYPSKD